MIEMLKCSGTISVTCHFIEDALAGHFYCLMEWLIAAKANVLSDKSLAEVNLQRDDI